MGRAAQDAAAEGQAALEVPCATDLATLAWVRAEPLGQLGGVMPAAPVPVLGPVGYMDRCTVTSLHHAGSL
ncbi:MAG TPA: hypothetical protein VN969_33115 [Streptosporangiaceae bacterium]|nr:hypothetical protein [Streptosporangiaceae bacterium]